jgi:hypothetical protein
MPTTLASIQAGGAWSKVDVLTPYQRITAEIQLRGRLRETMNDPETLFHLRNVTAEPLLPGAVALNGVPDGLFSKALICGIRTVEAEAPSPDEVTETTRRYAMYQGRTFMVTGFAEFPKAASAELHAENLYKLHFFQLLDVTVTMIGIAGRNWTQPNIWVNRDQMLAIYLG